MLRIGCLPSVNRTVSQDAQKNENACSWSTQLEKIKSSTKDEVSVSRQEDLILACRPLDTFLEIFQHPQNR
jgi:hypothetical protein